MKGVNVVETSDNEIIKADIIDDKEDKKGNKRFHAATLLSNEQTADLIYALATGDVPETRLVLQYKLGRATLDRFKSNHRFKIAELKAELAKQRDEIFKAQLGSRRAQILESISKKDIAKAGLGTKTRSIADLTQVKALEEGKATQNIDIAIGGMSKEQIVDFILGKEADKGNPVVDGVILPDDK